MLPITKAPFVEGPTNAAIIFIGEAPGAEEERAGEGAFIGAAGQLLTELASSAGISRSSCYFDNVLQFRPPQNNITPFIKIQGKKVIESPAFVEARKELLARLKGTTANIIVTLGNVSTYAITGRTAITKQRGSILLSEDLPERKIMPCIHPSAALREYLFRYWIVNDLQRAKEHSAFPETGLLERNFILSPGFTETLSFIKSCHSLPLIAYDIEVRNQELSHLSIARNPSDVICIPFVNGNEDYWSIDQETEILLAIAKLLEDPSITKVGQNITFDATFLYSKFGILTNSLEDTMIAQGVLFPDFPKGLDFLTSIYCEGEPYYKDDGKEWFKNPFGSDEIFRRYNAMDSAVLMEIWPKQQEELLRQGNLETYKRQRSLVLPLVYAGNKGIRMNIPGLQEEVRKSKEKISSLQVQLNSIVGRELNINSTTEVQHYFYSELKLRAHLKKGRITADDKALKQIAARGQKEASLILALRHEKKMLSTYFTMTFDPDNRLRCSFNPVGTVHGRISSSKTIRGTGGNQQNQPDEMNALMLADEGFLLVNQDLSQAENRVVAYVVGEEKMISAFEAGLDIHKQTAALIFRIPISEVTPEQRANGKSANHGLNYDLGAPSFANIYQLPLPKATFIVESYHKVYPGIREGHATIRYELSQNNRTLINCYGRRRTFLDRWGHGLFKAAYNYNPQSTVADKMNQSGVIFLYKNQDHFPEVQFLNTIHDSIRYQIPLSAGFERIIEIIAGVKQELERPIHWKGRSFSIPTDTELGFAFNKKTMLEWKASYFNSKTPTELSQELSSYVQKHS